MTTTLIIEKLGIHGDGVAIVGVEDIFVPFSLPGETVVRDGNTDRITVPSADRVKAPCSHFKKCGGCNLQHANDALVAEWKTNVVRETLALNYIETDIRPIKTSPTRSRRRAVLTAKRTKKSAEIGFHRRQSDTLINVVDCTIMHPAIMAGFDFFKALTILGCSRKSEIRICATVSANGLDVSVTKAKELENAQTMEIAQLAAKHKVARVSWNGELVAQLDPPYQDFAGAKILPPDGAFLQATAQGEAALVDAVTQALEGCKNVVDLFCGVGTFTFPIAKFAETHAVEAVAPMVASIDAAWRKTSGFKKVTTEKRDLYERPLLLDEFKKVDGVVIDPPRAGALEQCKVLAKSKVSKIAFVSCNPASFSRDAKILIKGGYQLDWVQVVDQFRWSEHIELAAQFTHVG